MKVNRKNNSGNSRDRKQEREKGEGKSEKRLMD